MINFWLKPIEWKQWPETGNAWHCYAYHRYWGLIDEDKLGLFYLFSDNGLGGPSTAKIYPPKSVSLRDLMTFFEENIIY